MILLLRDFLLKVAFLETNGEGYDTSEDSSSKCEIGNVFKRPRIRQREDSGITVTSRVTKRIKWCCWEIQR